MVGSLEPGLREYLDTTIAFVFVKLLPSVIERCCLPGCVAVDADLNAQEFGPKTLRNRVGNGSSRYEFDLQTARSKEKDVL